MNEWVSVDVDVWARSSIINDKAFFEWTLQFIRHFAPIIPLRPHETL